MSILCHELTREECEAIRENDGYLRGLEEGEAKGEARGEAKGRTQGLLEGKTEEKRNIARNMLAKGLDIKTISEVTGLTETEISEL